MASSLICATKKLSTMLYREFTSMERAMGSPIESSSGSTGRSFIKVSFIAGSFASGGWHKKATQLVKIAVWRKGTCSGKIHPKSFTGAIIRESRPLVKGFPGPAPRPAAGPSPPAGQSRCAAQRSAPPPAPASGTGRCPPWATSWGVQPVTMSASITARPLTIKVSLSTERESLPSWQPSSTHRLDWHPKKRRSSWWATWHSSGRWQASCISQVYWSNSSSRLPALGGTPPVFPAAS